MSGQMDRPGPATAAGSPRPTRLLSPDRSLAGPLVCPALLERGLTAEHTLEQRKVCRTFGRGICRALGTEHIRHGRAASAAGHISLD